MTSRYSLGLLGHPLGHSYSPLIHQTLLELTGLSGQYQLFDYTEAELQDGAISRLILSGVHGFNVTIPYKVLLHDKLSVLTPEAKRIGAVNTVFQVEVEQEITLIGHNTDASGFYKSLSPATQNILAGGHALVIGGGGSARAILSALCFEGTAPIQHVTLMMRSPEKGEALARRFQAWCDERHAPSTLEVLHPDAVDANILSQVDVLIHCTPLGMHPEPNALPLSLIQVEALNPQAHVVDLIYNPTETALMQAVKQRGCPVVQNGLGMLIHQAIEAFCTWTKLSPEPHWFTAVEARLLERLS